MLAKQSKERRRNGREEIRLRNVFIQRSNDDQRFVWEQKPNHDYFTRFNMSFHICYNDDIGDIWWCSVLDVDDDGDVQKVAALEWFYLELLSSQSVFKPNLTTSNAHCAVQWAAMRIAHCNTMHFKILFIGPEQNKCTTLKGENA